MEKYLISLIALLFSLQTNAQLLNFSLQTNNQQLIDEALSGAFVRIDQYYELCDTINNEHFGRYGKDYFSIVPFLGVQVENGVVISNYVLTPWLCDADFSEYRNNYKPIITKYNKTILNCDKSKSHSITKLNKSIKLSEHLISLNDSTISYGLKVDTLEGRKNGWLIWLSSKSDLLNTDSVRVTSFKKEINVSKHGGTIYIENPNISDKVIGGIYITPMRTSIGQLTFLLTGILVSVNDEWIIDIPFVKKEEDNKTLTPINVTNEWNKLNSLKKKRK